MRGGTHIVTIRRITLPIGTIWILVCLYRITGTSAAHIGSNQNLENSLDKNPTLPVDFDRTQWRGCHGYPSEVCRHIREKMKQLAQLLEQKSKGDGKSDVTFTNVTLTEEEEEGEEVVYLTPEQIQYFTDALRTGRKKRKVEQFNKFVTKWPLPIEYTFDGTHGNLDQQKIKEALCHWEAQTCLRFKEIASDDPQRSKEHRIIFMKYRGCGSYIGRVNIMPQPVDLASKCLKHFGIIAHEIGHVIGFWHEHQRSDRDGFIDIKVNNAISGMAFVSELMRLGRTSNLLPYDYGSVLHYSSKTMSVNGEFTIETKDPLYQRTIGQRTGLSFLDAKLANLVYCKDSCSVKLPRACQNNGYQDPNACTRCRCPAGFSGDYCGSLAPPVNAICGGTVYGSRSLRHIASPGYQTTYYKDHAECNWLLKAPKGQQIVFSFVETFEVYCHDQTCFHWVEVRYEADLTKIGPRFCCNDRPKVKLRSAGTAMLVLFRSNYTTYGVSRRGWRARFYTEPTPNNANPGDDSNNHLGHLVFLTPSGNRVTAPSNSGVTYFPTQPLGGSPNSVTPWAGPNWRTPSTRASTPEGPTRDPTTPRWAHGCAPLDIAFIIDSSGSIGFENWLRALQFTTDLVKKLNVASYSNRVGAVSFGSTASLQFNLLDWQTEYDVIEAMRRIPWKDEMTNTSGGIWVAQEFIFRETRGDRAEAPNVAVLLTDGESNRDTELTIPAAIAAKRAGMAMVVIGVGPGVKYSEVKAIASEPYNEFLFLVDKFSEIDKLFGSILNAICSVAANPPTYFPTSNTVEDRRSTTWHPWRPSTTPNRPPPTLACSEPGYADVTFVLDSSGSIGPDNWRKVLNFLKSVVGSLDVPSGMHQVGVVSFGSYATSEFHLDTYHSDLNLIRAIDIIPWRDEMTNTSGGLKVMRKMFESRYGDRAGVPDIAVVITDGESNRDPYLVRPEAEKARQAGIVLFVIGIGDKLNMVELQDIANKPTDQFLFHTRDFNDLGDVKANIINGICLQTSKIRGFSRSSTLLPWYRTDTTRVSTRFPSPSSATRTTVTPPWGSSRTTYTSTPAWWGSSHASSTWNPPWPSQSTRFPTSHVSTSPTWFTWSTWSPWSTGRPTGGSTHFRPSGTGTRQGTSGSTRTRSPGDCQVTYGDIAFVLDSSGSVGYNNWPKVLNFTKTLIKMLPIGPSDFKVGVITFGNEATIEIGLNDWFEVHGLLRTIDNVRWKDEWTNTSGAMRMMRERMLSPQHGSRPDAPRIGILVTDGESNKDKYRTIPEANNVHRAGIKMFAVGVGPHVDMNELEAIASDPLRTYLIHTPTFRNLWSLARDIRDKLCYLSEPVSTSTTMASTPSVVDPDVGPGSYKDCFPMELAVVLDSSSSIGSRNWRLLIDFVKIFVKELPIGPSRDRVAVVSFGNTGTLHFNLRQYRTLAGVLDGLDQVRWKNEWTNTSGGLLVMRSQVFTHTEPDRYGVPRVGLLLTDGKSNVDPHLTVPEANVARQQKVEMFAVGITREADVDEVRSIADLPASRHAFFAQDFLDLYQLRTTLLNAVCYSVRTQRNNHDKSGPAAPPPPPAPTPKPTTTTTISPEEAPWGPWTACSRLCGGCGRRWRYRQCPDGNGRTVDCGVPQEGGCNKRPCAEKDICKFYVAYREYNRPCQKCCYGYELRNNMCVPT